ncbi:Glycosyl hydrolases family 16 [Zhouia amylolytica]|uniref:Glycosyl hydrolases family 16 n=1 Tax=Zhouia amylolytica TaxID=376730 RepID=A0A1I6UKJ1_9FLAO|nr:glycoside hydrolase family 16 protein [Zhouia amylolytica]MCQ0112707.1 glycoside hydrolase family 16 protein [Zhouia amylolytica]SFT01928.1 Glycosyl hydrolases family 16 [Zhouia amylolytica]
MFKYISVLILLLVGCKSSKMETLSKKEWNIIWEDNFDKDKALDHSKWTKIKRNKADWGNYMTDYEGCFEIKNGNLHLKGIQKPDHINDTVPYLTGGVETKGKFSFQYGKIEIKAKLDSGKGVWPAIWMLADQPKYGKYPRNGEIDIMEHLNYENKIYQTVHSYYTLVLKEKENPPYYSTTEVNTENFNVYGLEWYPDKLVFTLNGKKTFEYPRLDNVDETQWPFDQPFYLMIDMQIEGSWVGEADPKDLPVEMIIDWVKVYQ